MIALRLALASLDLPLGSEVILPTYVCEEVLEAVIREELQPLLADVRADWTLCPESCASLRSPRTAAVIVVAPFGFAPDLAPFRALGLPIVFDAAQGLGTLFADPSLAQAADRVVLSMHATKELGIGRGGAVYAPDIGIVTALDTLAEKRGWLAPSDLEAALGVTQLARWDVASARRAELARHYLVALTSAPVTFPRGTDAYARGTPFRFVFRQRAMAFADVAALGEAAGVAVRRGVDTLLHRADEWDDSSFPGAVAAFNETVSVPYHPSLDDGQRDRVTEFLKALSERLRRARVSSADRET